MVPSTKASTSQERKMDLDSLVGQISQAIVESSMRITFMERVRIPGPMAESSTENGPTIKCTESVCSHGPMAESTKASMLMIRKKDMVSFFGLITESMMATGWAADKKVSACITMHKIKLNMVDG